MNAARLSDVGGLAHVGVAEAAQLGADDADSEPQPVGASRGSAS